MNLNVGDRVVIVCPENARLHGTHATVAAVAEWGVHLAAPAAATGAFRALFSEVKPLAVGLMGTPAAPLPAEEMSREDQEAVANGYRAWKSRAEKARAANATGDVCPTCQGPNMLRSGACLICQDCGSTTGCG